MVEIIIAAAGLGRRMGRWKPEVPFQGKPLLHHSLTAALKTPWPVILVGGHNYQRLKDLVDDFLENHPPWAPRITLIENPFYSRGPGESFAAGLERSRGNWLFLALGDLPLITAETFGEVYKSRRPPACRPVYKNQPGHPVLLARSLLPQIFKRRREILPTLGPGEELTMRQLTGPIHPLSWTDEGVVFDIDTPDLLSPS